MQSIAIVPLKDQAAAALRRQIYAGQLADGTELRQEDIAARLGISRLPVREALQQLQNEGLLVRLPNRHVRVVGMTAARLRQNFALLAAMEEELLVQAGDTLLHAALPAPEQDEEFHTAAAAALDNPTLYQLFLTQRRALMGAVLAISQPDPAEQTAQNQKIAAALAAGQDPRPAVRSYYEMLAEQAVEVLGL